MPADPRWAYYQPRAWIVVEGQTIDVVAFHVGYELNGIPQAQVALAIGRNAETGRPSPVHSLLAALTVMTPVQLFVELANRVKSDAQIESFDLPNGPFLLFDGRTAGPGYTKSSGAEASYVLTLNHWLVDLASSSAFSNASHPGNPSNYSYGGLMLASGTAGGTDWTVMTQAHSTVTQEALQGDFWKALYEWFKVLTSRDGFWAQEAGAQNANPAAPGDVVNNGAAEMLKRLVPGGKDSVPMKFRSTVQVDIDLAYAISQDIVQSTANPGFTANQTIWDMLVGNFASDYLFAVVPRVLDALVVPFIPCYRGNGGKAFKDVTAAAQTSVNLTGTTPRPIRAQGILSGLATRTGVDLTVDGGPPNGQMGIGGFFDKGPKNGLIYISSGPRWMSSVLAPTRFAEEASGANLQPIGNALAPGAGAKNDGHNKGAARGPEVIKPLLNAYAQARFVQEALRGRYFLFSGPFRVDIAPGSLIRVEGSSELAIADLDTFGEPKFAQVLHVAMHMDAQQKQIGTAFHAAYCRTTKENGSELTSVSDHPLYEKSFNGCRLVNP